MLYSWIIERTEGITSRKSPESLHCAVSFVHHTVKSLLDFSEELTLPSRVRGLWSKAAGVSAVSRKGTKRHTQGPVPARKL